MSPMLCAPGQSNQSRPTTYRRRGFTLIEILVVVVILGILAAMIIPGFHQFDTESRAKSQAANVRKVRELIQIHRHSGDYPVNAAGWPATIDSAWFRGNRIPEHMWTRAAMNIEEVAAGANVYYPLAKTFNPANPGEFDSWYNTDNGRFCARVPDQGNAPDTIVVFNLANSTQITGMGQTQ